jgi:hypothetical protein
MTLHPIPLDNSFNERTTLFSRVVLRNGDGAFHAFRLGQGGHEFDDALSDLGVAKPTRKPPARLPSFYFNLCFSIKSSMWSIASA